MSHGLHRAFQLLAALAFVASVLGCANEPPRANRGAASSSEQAIATIEASVPKGISDRAGWVHDIYAGFSAQGLDATHENVCAVVAVIQQESNFHVDPPVSGLGGMARNEIETRAQRAGVPLLIVRSALGLRSPNGQTYIDRINAARTEKQLSDIYEDFIGSVPLGRTLFENLNPIRTRGPMQVNIAFANQYAAVRSYPYPVKTSIADEVFTRRGSLYFGIAHLLAYRPPYDAFLFRFADFNAGQFASRNAAFQNAVSRASGVPLVTDGVLLPDAARDTGETEQAVRSVAARISLNATEIHSELERGKGAEFESTKVYERIFALAERRARQPLPHAIVPTITLHGPKISHHLTTSWYAHRVEGRFERCVRR